MLEDRVLDDAVVEAVDGRFARVAQASATEVLPPSPFTILPGLVDIHCHGGGGHSFAAGATSAEQAASFQARRGTTRLLASLVSSAPQRMLEQTSTVSGLVADGRLSGIHLEGPFLSPRRRGVHPAERLRAPDSGFTSELLQAGRGTIRSVTVAPELPGAPALVEQLVTAGAVPAVGHTDASFAEAQAAFERGAGLTTHLFNGMRPWHHRDAGVAPACLAAASAGRGPVELIGDGVHLDDGTVAAVFQLLPRGVVLVSDATPAAGQVDGTYRMGDIPVRMQAGVVRDADGALAGGGGTLLDVVRRAHQHAGVGLVDAVRAATAAPAAAVGLDDVGTFSSGARADVVCLDDDLRLVAVARDGRWLVPPPKQHFAETSGS